MTRSHLPQSTALTAPFRAAARVGRLVVQRCRPCGALRHYPQLRCPQCHSGDHDWAELTGRGVIYSYTVTHQAFAPAWADRVPYVVATIELDEGVRMVSDLDESAEDVAIGIPVEVFFDDAGDGIALPRFRVLATPLPMTAHPR